MWYVYYFELYIYISLCTTQSFLGKPKQNLILQNLGYEIYVIEQYGLLEEPFNRAKLFNVGVIEGILRQEMYKKETHESQTSHHCYCVILHDVDTVSYTHLTLPTKA